MYVIITNSIINVGGAQSYCVNKKKTLEKQGNRVLIISTTKGQILCPDLNEYSDCIVGQLRFPPYFYSDRNRTRIVDQIIRLIRTNNVYHEPVFIESHMLYLAMWSDLVANEIKAKHLYMDITEGYKHFSSLEKEYLFHKRESKSIFSNGNKSFDKLLESDKTGERFCPTFSPFVYMGPDDSDVPEKWLNLHLGVDYLIGSIGRIDKPFVSNMIHEIAEYIANDRIHSYRFVFIGDSSDRHAKRKLIEYLREHNIDYMITGFMYPIPSKLIKQFDLFLSSAGATRNSAECMIPTIVYSAVNYEPIDFFQGSKVTMYSLGNKSAFESMVYTALNNGSEVVFEENKPRSIEYYERKFCEQIELFNSVGENVLFVPRSEFSKKEKLMKFIVSSFGYRCAIAALKAYSIGGGYCQNCYWERTNEIKYHHCNRTIYRWQMCRQGYEVAA